MFSCFDKVVAYVGLGEPFIEKAENHKGGWFGRRVFIDGKSSALDNS